MSPPNHYELHNQWNFIKTVSLYQVCWVVSVEGASPITKLGNPFFAHFDEMLMPDKFDH